MRLVQNRLHVSGVEDLLWNYPCKNKDIRILTLKFYTFSIISPFLTPIDICLSNKFLTTSV